MGGPDIMTAGSLQQFVRVLKTPRNILIMLKAGKPVAAMIQELTSLLIRGDLIIDGGNSYIKTPNAALLIWKRGVWLLPAWVFPVVKKVPGWRR